MDIERRAIVTELRVSDGDVPRLTGHAALFDVESRDLGGFVEFVRPGAFRRSLESGADVMALVNHDVGLILGRTKAGTLKLSEDERGLAFEINPPDTQNGRDIVTSVRRGDIQGASFAFTVPPAGDRWRNAGKRMERDLIDVDLIDVTITPVPAYEGADVAVAQRMFAAWRAGAVPSPYRRSLAARYLQTLER